jgi:hypothetical protein
MKVVARFLVVLACVGVGSLIGWFIHYRRTGEAGGAGGLFGALSQPMPNCVRPSDQGDRRKMAKLNDALTAWINRHRADGGPWTVSSIRFAGCILGFSTSRGDDRNWTPMRVAAALDADGCPTGPIKAADPEVRQDIGNGARADFCPSLADDGKLAAAVRAYVNGQRGSSGWQVLYLSMTQVVLTFQAVGADGRVRNAQVIVPVTTRGCVDLTALR